MSDALKDVPSGGGVYTDGRAGEEHGHIRSFVRRAGRMSEAQERYYAEMMPKIGVPYAAAPLDLEAAFGRSAPKILEIGFGMGETTAKIAAACPERDFLGVEVHTPGVGALCKLIATQGLTNLRICQHDAVEVVRDMLPEGSLDGVHVFFPDPWHKKRHNKRRLIQPPFVALLASMARRSAVIFAVGLALNLVPSFDWAQLRIPGVLQRIALCSLLAAPLVAPMLVAPFGAP